MENKKGQQMTLGTIIAIVLGLVVLIFLIYGFSTGWGNLWERVTGLGGGDVNVDTVQTSCVLACQQKNKYGFCSQKRNVVFEDGVEAKGKTCDDLTGPISVGGATTTENATLAAAQAAVVAAGTTVTPAQTKAVTDAKAAVVAADAKAITKTVGLEKCGTLCA